MRIGPSGGFRTAGWSAPDADAVPRLRGLRKAQDARLALAHDLSVSTGRLSGISEQTAGGQTTWTLRIVPEDLLSRSGMEMAYNNISPDEIAELRARRILLDDETLSSDSMLETLVRGMDVPLKPDASPFAPLYHDLGAKPPETFIAAARLVGVTIKGKCLLSPKAWLQR